MALMMEAVSISEMSVNVYQTTQRRQPSSWIMYFIGEALLTTGYLKFEMIRGGGVNWLHGLRTLL
jgi:hypothetical protein